MDEVVVTGSRIVSPNLQSISPITAIGAEELNIAGKSRIEDVLNQLPQAFASQGSNISNASDGTATVDLRGLGSQRTLVLVNGKRLMPGDPDGGSAADLNQIPLTLVKRVDVLTGGASSVYGADAVAGVVNFVMDSDFEGVRIDSNYSFYNHKNDQKRVQDIVESKGYALPDSTSNVGYSKDFSIAVGIGGAEGRGHATFYGTYREVDPVLQSKLDYSACTLNLAVAGTNYTCGGSQTSDPAGFFVFTPPGYVRPSERTPAQPEDPTLAACLDTGCILGAGGVMRPFAGADAFNFGPVNYFQRPDTRYTAGAFANFKISESADVYTELMFMDDRSVAQIAPSGSFFGEHVISCANPLWSASTFQNLCGNFGLTTADSTDILIGRRNSEGGGRQDDVNHESYRVVVGIRGELSDIFSYDAFFQTGETKRNETYFNDFSVRRTGLALNVATDPKTGQPACSVNADADGSNDDPACVPWNIWQAGGVTPEALAYLQTPGFQRATARQEIVHGDVTADLTSIAKLPSTETGLVLNFGAEYRAEHTNFTVDSEFSTGDLAGQGGATLPVEGRFDVQELFFEGRMPLVEGKTGMKELSIEAGYRYSDYSTDFTTDTYKAGLDWAPLDMLRFRGSYQRAVRAPNVGELFSSQSVALDGSQDPCAGTTDLPTAEQCARTGVTASQYGHIAVNSSGQYNGLLGGNRELQPETSDTVSFGFVLRPPVGDLSIAIDYFDIKIDNVISSVVGGNADTYINTCIETGELCNLIHRSPTNGSLWLTPDGYIEDTSLNLGSLKTSGTDLQASYTLNLGENRIGLNLVGTLLNELATQPLPGGPSYDCRGFYGGTCGVPAPRWRHAFRTNWRTPWSGLDIAATWRFFGKSRSERLSSNDQLGGNVNANGISNSVPSFSYLDLTASMTVAEKFTFRVGANNVLDKTPPIIPSGGVTDCPAGPCNGNTWAQVYDALGRQVFATVTVDF
jgi:iron complex outermembrane receptor protein